MWDVVLLDLDGPLLDVSERYFKVHLSIIRERRPVPEKGAYWHLKRQNEPMASILSRLVPAIDERDYAAQWLARIEDREFLRLDRIVPGARAAVNAIAQTGVPCILVTLRRNREAMMEQLASLDILHYFDIVLSEGPETRPAWEVKARLIRDYGHPASRRVVIVGDSEADVMAGQLLGITTVAVTNGIRSSAFLQALNPDHMIPGIREFPALMSSAPTMASGTQQ